MDRTARLARLVLPDEELAELAPQFERILAAFRTLARFEGGAPSVGPEPLGRARADEPQPSHSSERALANAPEPLEGFFGVPKTIGGASGSVRGGSEA